MKRPYEIIAEVKTRSPFGFQAIETWDEQFERAQRIGNMISVHTDPRWGGSFDLLKRARALTVKPIVAKGIHATDDLISQAIDTGADWVLVVGRIPAVHADRCLIEPLTLPELVALPSRLRAVWNSRDIETGGLKKETFTDARKIWNGWLCQASNIKTIADVEASANAILVGTHLREFEKSLN